MFTQLGARLPRPRPRRYRFEDQGGGKYFPKRAESGQNKQPGLSGAHGIEKNPTSVKEEDVKKTREGKLNV